MPLETVIDRIRCSLYDKVHGVETCAKVDIHSLTIRGANAANGMNYRATPPTSIRHLIRAVGGDVQNTTFIDMGSGFGRCLLVASEYPFRSVIGVEFAEELHKKAVENIRVYRGKRACRDVRSIHADAADFILPDGNLLIHFFNPFGASVMDAVLASVRKHGGSVTMAFMSGCYAIESVQKAFQLLQETGYYDIYRKI